MVAQSHVLLFLVVSTSALFLSSTVGAICVKRKLESLSGKQQLPRTSAVFKPLPQTRTAVFKSLPQTTSAFFKSLPQVTVSVPKDETQVDHSIVDICHKTDYVDVCVSSVIAYLKGSADGISLLKAEIKAAEDKVAAAITEVSKLSADPSTSLEAKQNLDICKENFEYAVDSLKNSQNAIASHDMGTLNSELSAVITYAGTCDDAFEEDPGVTSPMADIDGALRKLGSNCLAIAAQLNEL